MLGRLREREGSERSLRLRREDDREWAVWGPRRGYLLMFSCLCGARSWEGWNAEAGPIC